ncbi:hypothetical protein N8K70_09400 [Microbacterium betulae]|uniref:Uncharacterized protein n=1 Tax=Microbacterium betulae TaxID=2981139 RepID=A0AA97FEM8_9MICO|nr:hypothetical protein [Microbacterium sp. AB]WOF21610.1 hypothetical protein N8K70_09400 [Microbacterium sp. AB]
MNTTDLSPTAHPPQAGPSPARVEDAIAAIPARTPRTSTADRLAMRIGLWLLLWSTRPSDDRESAERAHAARLVADATRAEHDVAVARAQSLYGAHRFIR